MVLTALNLVNTPKKAARLSRYHLTLMSNGTQMKHIRFYKSNGPVTLEAAHDILGSGDFSLFGASSHGIKEFKNDLEEPIMISLKRGLMKNMLVSNDEPTCVTTIKKSLFAELQKLNSTFGLKHLKKQPIVSVLPIPSRPKKVDVQI